MNLASIILIIIIAICFAAALRYTIKHKGSSCKNCYGDCQQCKYRCKKQDD